MDNRNTLTLPQLIQRVLRTASLTLGGHRALHLDAKDYYRLLELADAAGAIEPAPPAQAPAPGREEPKSNLGSEGTGPEAPRLTGERLTHHELNRAEMIWHDVRRGRRGHQTTLLAALEAVIRDYNQQRVYLDALEAAPASVSGPPANRTNPNPQNPAPRGEKEAP